MIGKLKDFEFYEDMLTKYQKLNRESVISHPQSHNNVHSKAGKMRTLVIKGKKNDGLGSLIKENKDKIEPLRHRSQKTKKTGDKNVFGFVPVKVQESSPYKDWVKRNEAGFKLTVSSTSQLQSNSEEKSKASQELKSIPFISQLYDDSSPTKKKDLMRAIKIKSQKPNHYNSAQEKSDNDERCKINYKLSTRIFEASSILALALAGRRGLGIVNNIKSVKSKSKSKTKTYSLRKRGKGSSESFVYEETLLQKVKAVCCL